MNTTAAPAPVDADIEIFCPQCDYNLRGLASGVCPECGRPFDPEALREPTIPWVHRRTIGRIRAFWHTVWMITVHPRRLCREMSKPVSLDEARRFRRAVWRHLAVSLLFTAALLIAIADTDGWADAASLTVIIAVAAYLWLALVLCTGMSGWFCAPRQMEIERQNRSIALSHYACAPLAWLRVPSVLVMISFLLTANDEPATDLAAGIVMIAACAAFMLSLILWAVTVVGTIARITGRSGSATAGIAVALPLAWLIVPAVFIGTIVLTIAYGLWMLISLT